jgi:hypothetical protein
MLKVDFGKGPEPVPIGDVTVKRHGRPKALEGIGGIKAREFGMTEQAEMERFAREGGFAEIPEGMHANPVFSPRFWQTADAAIRPFSQKIDSAIGRAVGRLPFSIRRWLREDPATKRIIQETRREVGERQSETEAVLRMVLRENPTPAELALADRIARGVPADVSSARPKMRPILEQAAQDIHGLAQQMTSERAALGLPIREEWVSGPRRWYPNLWKQHLVSPRMVAGRLFSKLRPKRAEMGSLRPRTTDRYTVVDSSGTITRAESGNQAIFRTMEEAQAFIREQPRRRLRIVEPMTHEQAVAHGLIEDLAVNLRQGFGREWSLLAKTRALETIGREFASDTPRPGYVNLSERGFQVPVQLAKRNPHIARLRDGYVPEEMATTLTAYYGPRGAFSTFFRTLEGSLRKWVTIRNPFRHPKQLVENELTLAFGDPVASLNWVAKGRAFRDFARGARGEQNIPYWDEYRKSNLWYSDIVRGEFETVWRGVDSVNPESAPLSLRERMALWAEDNAVARDLMAADKFAEKLYRAEDQVYKFYEYRTLRERGLSPQEAEYRTSRTFFDYSDVPPIIRGANRFIPFAPNVTYQFSRIIGTALRDRPVSTAMKLALLVHGYAFVREEMMRAAGITEQDEKNMGKLAPAWHELVLPITGSKGRNIKVSILWLIPYGELLMLKDILSPEDPERGAAALAHRVVPMAAQPIVTVATSRKSFGQKFLSGTETPAEANRKRASEFIKGYLPGLLGQYWERLYKNATAGEERKKPLLQKALVEPVTGRIERFTPEGKIGLRKALLAGKAREVQEEAGRQRGRFIRGTTSAETFREEVGKLRTRITQEGVAHPETVAVLDALERGGDERTQATYQRLVAHGSRPSRDEVRTVILKLLEQNQNARAAFRELTRSRFYETPKEAFEALVDIQRRKARLTELEQTPLPETRAAVEGVLEELRRTGRASRATRQQLVEALKALPQSDQKAILDWLQDQITAQKGVKERERRRTAPVPRGNLAPAPGVPRQSLAPAPGL